MTTTGWILFIAALGMMAGLVGQDISEVKTWTSVTEPAFIGKELIHFATVVAAFIGGKLIPPERDPAMRTRAVDPPPLLPGDFSAVGGRVETKTVVTKTVTPDPEVKP